MLSNVTPYAKLLIWTYIEEGGYSGDINNNCKGADVINRSGGNIFFAELSYCAGSLGLLASVKIRQNGDVNIGVLKQRTVIKMPPDVYQPHNNIKSHPKEAF